MKKKLIGLVLAIAIFATIAYAATSTGEVVAVDGNKVTITFTDHDLKVGDKVKVENGGKDGKFGGGGFKMKGC